MSQFDLMVKLQHLNCIREREYSRGGIPAVRVRENEIGEETCKG